MMNDHIHMAIAKSHQEDLLARSEQRRLAKTVKRQSKEWGARARVSGAAACRPCPADLG